MQKVEDYQKIPTPYSYGELVINLSACVYAFIIECAIIKRVLGIFLPAGTASQPASELLVEQRHRQLLESINQQHWELMQTINNMKLELERK